MTQPIAYEDAVDLLDADHKAVKKLFIRYAALCDDGADVQEKRMVAERICQDLTIHAQIEEEIFYPAVREIIGDDSMMDKALEEHAEAKEAIAQIQEMDSTDQGYDAIVKRLAKLVDQHVLEEREQIFLKARYAALDLRGLTAPLLARKKQLQKTVTTPIKEVA